MNEQRLPDRLSPQERNLPISMSCDQAMAFATLYVINDATLNADLITPELGIANAVAQRMIQNFIFLDPAEESLGQHSVRFDISHNEALATTKAVLGDTDVLDIVIHGFLTHYKDSGGLFDNELEAIYESLDRQWNEMRKDAGDQGMDMMRYGQLLDMKMKYRKEENS